MENKKNKIQKWINLIYKLVIFGMLVFCVFSLINQQKEIKKLKGNLEDIEYNFDLSNIETDIQAATRAKLTELQASFALATRASNISVTQIAEQAASSRLPSLSAKHSIMC